MMEGGCCPDCGGSCQCRGARRPVIKRGALTATFDPPRIFWNDRAVPLSPTEASLLSLVMRRGRLCWAEVNEALGSSASARAVLLHRIRTKVEALGGADPVETIRHWGLRLRIEPDHAQSRTTWIGIDEASLRVLARTGHPIPESARSNKREMAVSH
jgi:hypothetical protein